MLYSLKGRAAPLLWAVRCISLMALVVALLFAWSIREAQAAKPPAPSQLIAADIATQNLNCGNPVDLLSIPVTTPADSHVQVTTMFAFLPASTCSSSPPVLRCSLVLDGLILKTVE